MYLRAIVAAGKTGIKVGAWRNGKVPKADFPIARNALRLGQAFEWCVVTFQALGQEVRVLVLFNIGKAKYDAILGVMANGMVRILCDYQFHSTEPGWHVHATCDSATRIPGGIFRGPWVKRIPAARSKHRCNEFGISNQSEALRFALIRYRIEEKGPLL